MKQTLFVIVNCNSHEADKCTMHVTLFLLPGKPKSSSRDRIVEQDPQFSHWFQMTHFQRAHPEGGVFRHRCCPENLK